MPLKTELKIKRPDDVLDFDFDFERLGWLDPGDTIVAEEVEVSAGSVVIDAHDFTDTTVKVWLSSGVDGETVTVTAKITTQQGRKKEACFRLRIKDRC